MCYIWGNCCQRCAYFANLHSKLCALGEICTNADRFSMKEGKQWVKEGKQDLMGIFYVKYVNMYLNLICILEHLLHETIICKHILSKCAHILKHIIAEALELKIVLQNSEKIWNLKDAYVLIFTLVWQATMLQNSKDQIPEASIFGNNVTVWQRKEGAWWRGQHVANAVAGVQDWFCWCIYTALTQPLLHPFPFPSQYVAVSKR